MAKRMMNEDGMIDLIWGAALLAGGGGGAMRSAMDLMNKYKADNPGDPLGVEICGVEDIGPGEYAASTAAIGSPVSFLGRDFTGFATNAFSGLVDMYAKMDPPVELKYSYAAEMGGFNTFVPLMISQYFKIPFIDADGAGRAVPAVNTTLFHINGCATAPMSMADDKNNRICFTLEDPRNAVMCEEICRNISASFGNLAGASGWLAGPEDFNRIVKGSITLAEKIGRIMRECAENREDVFAALTEKGIVECRLLGRGKVTEVESVVEKGFDYGKVVVDAGRKIVIHFQNENLLCEIDGEPVLTVPDITCTYEITTGLPLTNADITEGMEIAVGAIKVNDKWWDNPAMFDSWRPMLERIGYTGENIPY